MAEVSALVAVELELLELLLLELLSELDASALLALDEASLLFKELDAFDELLEAGALVLSSGTEPVKPVCPSWVMANTSVPSFMTIFSGAKSARFSSKVQLAFPQRLLSKVSNSSRQPPSNVFVLGL